MSMNDEQFEKAINKIWLFSPSMADQLRARDTQPAMRGKSAPLLAEFVPYDSKQYPIDAVRGAEQ